jgi:hypothetical protein
MPSRVIDVTTLSSGFVSIRPIDSSQVDYVALSYCWGGPQKRTLSQDVLVEWSTAGIAINSLSKTIQDAITVTHNLGVPYLWVDSLCVIQDSPEDLEKELVKMGLVYANALLTVVVADTISSEGFLNPQKQWYDEVAPPFQLPVMSPDGADITLVAEEHREYSPDTRPINRRAWTLQERIFSRRLLIFENNPNRLYWNCPNLLASCGGIQPEFLIKTSLRTLEARHPSIYFGQDVEASNWTINNSTHTQWSAHFDTQQQWRDICLDYATREIGLDSDRLNAIAGLAAKFQKALPAGYTYAAGLWLGRTNTKFLGSLIWGFSGQPQRPSEYIAPSWSWASQYGEISWTLPKYNATTDDRNPPRCEVLSYKPKLRFKTLHYGQLLEGSALELEGYLIPSPWHMKTHSRRPSSPVFNLIGVEDIMHTINFDDKENTLPEEIWRLPLFNGRGLIVEKIQSQSEDKVKYRRIGTYEVWEDHTAFDNWIDDKARTKIVLV